MHFIRRLYADCRDREVTLIGAGARAEKPTQSPTLKLTALTNRNPPDATKPSAARRGNFRQRYDAIEERRAGLVARLAALGEAARRHPGHRHALKLLNDTFRKAPLAQRLAVLQAAGWLIDILEKLISSA